MHHRLLLAAALCASLVFAGCAKSRETTTDTTTTTAGQTADATAVPADADVTPADSTAEPDAAAATPADEADTATAAAAPAGAEAASGTAMTFIVLPVYPGAAENADKDVAISANGSSMTMKVYTSRDDTKRVIDWYKAHLPSSFKNFAISSGDKTTGTFSSEGNDGDQSIIVATQDDRTTRIQLTTKHGK